MTRRFTSESVTEGHPDKLCDRIADTVLDELLLRDPYARVACEVMAGADRVNIEGEITAKEAIDYESVARRVIREVGYTEGGTGFDSESCKIEVNVHRQSPDIDRGVTKAQEENSGAGDQGMMFGYACKETLSLMPFGITYANRLTKRLAYARRSGELPHLRPDGKAQLTVEYQNDVPRRISAVVVSTQHSPNITTDRLREDVLTHVIEPVLPREMLDDETEIYINPTGRFVIGGPAGDTGLTGRKIIADTYGGYSRHGGGAFSGKDPTKVDRSGAYLARYLAKNVVAADLADRCEVQLAYAIGLAEPVSFMVTTFGTGELTDDLIAQKLAFLVDMRPAAIIKRFQLRRPFYAGLSCYGHFGENAGGLPYERCDLAEELKLWADAL